MEQNKNNSVNININRDSGRLMTVLMQLGDLTPFRMHATCAVCGRVTMVSVADLVKRLGPRIGLWQVADRLQCSCGGFASHIEIYQDAFSKGFETRPYKVIEKPGTCGRYFLASGVDAIAALFQIENRPNLPPRNNIGPTQSVPVIRQKVDRRELVQMRWGFIPTTSAKGPQGKPIINAIGGQVDSTPMFAAAFSFRRCLLPADGFYEWMNDVYGERQPWLFRLKDAQPFGMAGLWETWTAPEGEQIDSCVLITTFPNMPVRQVHDRMPAIIHPDHYDLWLSSNTPPAEASRLLEIYPSEEMAGYRVGKEVNHTRNDNPSLIEPLQDSAIAKRQP